MTKVDKVSWLTSSHAQMVASIDAILLAAGFTPRTVVFSIYETVIDPRAEDLSDWTVRHPDFASTFAAGKVRFDLGDDELGNAVLSKGYLNPTWADVLVEAERSCRGRGAPDLDHRYLEDIEENGIGADGAVFWTLVFGS